jgi:O-antigen ligase
MFSLTEIRNNIIFILSCLLMAAFFVSPALISISFGIIIGLGIVSLNSFKEKFKTESLFKIVTLLFLFFIAIHVMGILLSENLDEALRKFALKIPFLLLPFAIVILANLSRNQWLYLVLIFIYFTFFTGSVSTLIYLKNKEYFDPLVLQAKPIPINFGYGMFHIQFSILNAFACFAGIYFLMRRTFLTTLIFSYDMLKISLGVITFVNILNLHILSARTGLIAFYLAVFIVGLVYTYKYQKKFMLPLILICTLLPLAAYWISGSFSNRVKNSVEDITTIIYAQDPNDKSVAMRIEAWKTAWQIIKNKPFTGVGLGDMEISMQKQYEQNNSQLIPFNRKNPHNQFLETGVHLGMLGIILLIFFWLLLFQKFKSNYLAIGFAIMLLFSFFFESMLERQVSIVFFSFWVGLFFTHDKVLS